MTMSDKILTDAQVRARLGNKSQRTIDRWTADISLGFPQPIRIRGRKYRDATAIEAFEARLIAEAGAPAEA
jgi:predicted DNA-binding transcriptional regulator AlpA